ncbi:hypothetical protein L226DRAFT_79492 [Lentinus tigrinus ALCF2SS1-7]|uniref:F-box domain-containing protein n=1 Tax=Lentinus tigrinus ALCF2SS1-6 TaxID=1328759 RepID=A0A5C2SFT9_9APHY|nr:hypothetical protein L227DRAFT_50383 [Lentinus tigrinus ALCF2SS1-6]RPD74626.1 hypothetical protein L226DRAFT_79492 [Lentinus tigrinus ALCF2SS1-7]
MLTEVTKAKQKQWLQERDAVLVRQAALEQELARLNRLINAVVPINALPDELLIEIFGYFRATVSAEYQGGRNLAPQWMTIHGVCRRWRQVASSTPKFWRIVQVYRKPEWLSLSLSRCAQTAVDIQFLSPAFSPARGTILLSHAWLIRSLTIPSTNIAWNMVLTKLFSLPMPSLENLRLSPPLQKVIHHEDLGIAGSRLPRLRNLDLVGYFVPRDEALFANLRSLVMDSCPCPATFPQFLDLFSAAVRLEELTLLRCLHWFQGSGINLPPPPATRVVLANLRSMQIGGDSPLLTSHFLNSIQVPNASHIQIESDTFADDMSEVSDSMISTLPAEVPATFPMWPAVTSVEITADHDFFDIVAHTPANQTITVSLTSSLKVLQWQTFYEELVVDCTQLFADCPIQKLELQGIHDDVTEETWRSVFRQFQELETVILGGSGGSLDTFWKGLASTQDGHICCPRLTSITTGEDDSQITFSDFLVEEAFETLRKRDIGGARLGLLDVRLQRDDHDGAYTEDDGRLEATRRLETMVDTVSMVLVS